MRTYYVTLIFARGMPSYACEIRASDETSAVWMATKAAQGDGWSDCPVRHTVRVV
jgi:hypothetical protein